MKRILSSLLLAFVLVSLLGPWSLASADAAPAMKILSTGQPRIEPALRSKLNLLQSNETITVIVTLRQQADLSRVSGANRAARRQGILRALQATTDLTQKRIKGLLTARLAQGKVSRFQPFWVFNGFSVTATAEVINELAQHPDVLSISPDSLDIVPVLGPPEPNITLVNAPSLWNLGYFGQGVVVANMDSGVDVSHPDLSSRWRAGLNSWYDPYGQHPTTPTDLTGHGTQTMGVMVGGDAGGTTVGVAPSAQWIAVKIFDDSRSSTATAIHQGFQWLLDPDNNPATDDAPGVVNNSWTFANPGCNLDFEPDLQSLRAAGILPVFAAGNGGPLSNTSFSPSNNPSAFAVGAINNSSQIYGFSSRGPTTCGGSTGPYPELVAPGVNIRSTDLFSGYAIVTGTSLASPHVAGGLALLLSAYPNLSAAEQQNALINSSFDLGAAGPDDVYGYGRLDLLAAFNWLASAPTSTASPTSTPSNTPTFTPVPSNTATATATYTLTATNTATATRTPTATPTLLSTFIHVGDLDRSSVLSGTKWNATVTIRVHNNLEQPVAHATITGKWSNGATGTVTCTTNSSGFCTVTKTGISAQTISVTFGVTNVTATRLTYRPSTNHDPDGDSSGTIIVVLKP